MGYYDDELEPCDLCGATNPNECCTERKCEECGDTWGVYHVPGDGYFCNSCYRKKY